MKWRITIWKSRDNISYLDKSTKRRKLFHASTVLYHMGLLHKTNQATRLNEEKQQSSQAKPNNQIRPRDESSSRPRPKTKLANKAILSIWKSNLKGQRGPDAIFGSQRMKIIIMAHGLHYFSLAFNTRNKV